MTIPYPTLEGLYTTIIPNRHAKVQVVGWPYITLQLRVRVIYHYSHPQAKVEVNSGVNIMIRWFIS